jgi:protein-S-isoprenylcysteine O-methyltransferase Ste14
VNHEAQATCSIVKAAGFLAYLFITLEMLFMVTPFALYYYAAYRPLLAGMFSNPATTWLPAFFLPHLSMEIFPNIGGLVFLLGLAGFGLSAFQLYFAKFRRRGIVDTWFYKRIRHPQYTFLAIAGLGLLLVWPRFILLVIYVNTLWFYYLLARSEERRMEARFGEAYRAQERRTWMFLPREPGGFLQRRLFGWIHLRKASLAVTYIFSLIVSIGAAFLLRLLSLSATSHTILGAEKIAAISFVAVPEPDLRDMASSAATTEELQPKKAEKRWILVQVMQGKASVVHAMMDAGMTHRQAGDLDLAKDGMKFVISQQEGGFAEQPFGTRMRWQPALIVEMNEHKVSNIIALERAWFSGNPVMPLF